MKYKHQEICIQAFKRPERLLQDLFVKWLDFIDVINESATTKRCGTCTIGEDIISTGGRDNDFDLASINDIKSVNLIEELAKNYEFINGQEKS